jgi:O-antigen/teichoic acid export membrane protein
MYLNIMLSQVLIAAKRQMAWTWVMGVATIINPVFNLVLIPALEHSHHNGGIGAAISLLLTEIAIVSIGFALVGRAVIDRHLLRRVALASLASLAMWLVATLTAGLGVVVSLTLAGVTFLVLAMALGLASREELATARSVVAGRLPLRRLRARS